MLAMHACNSYMQREYMAHAMERLGSRKIYHALTGLTASVRETNSTLGTYTEGKSAKSTRSKSQVSGKRDLRITLGLEGMANSLLLLFIMIDGESSEAVSS